MSCPKPLRKHLLTISLESEIEENQSTFSRLANTMRRLGKTVECLHARAHDVHSSCKDLDEEQVRMGANATDAKNALDTSKPELRGLDNSVKPFPAKTSII